MSLSLAALSDEALLERLRELLVRDALEFHHLEPFARAASSTGRDRAALPGTQSPRGDPGLRQRVDVSLPNIPLVHSDWPRGQFREVNRPSRRYAGNSNVGSYVGGTRASVKRSKA